jgi:hypothetical protein
MVTNALVSAVDYQAFGLQITAAIGIYAWLYVNSLSVSYHRLVAYALCPTAIHG